MIPDLPAEPLGKFAGDLAASTSVFTLDGYNAVH
jgi:hypothetical protein